MIQTRIPIHSILVPSPSVPPIFATITESTTTPTVGQGYTLNCTLSGVKGTPTYQWRKNGSIINGHVEHSCSFLPLTLSDAGQYSCIATLGNVEYSASKDIVLQGS